MPRQSRKTVRWTPAAIAALPRPHSAAGREFHYHPSKVGLAVRTTPSGPFDFYAYRKVGGEPIKLCLGVFDPSIPAGREIPNGVDPLAYVGNAPALNPRMAERLFDSVVVEFNRGSNPGAVVRSARRLREGELTLTQGFERYERDYLLHEQKRSAQELRAVFERYVGALPEVVKRPRGRERTKSPHGVDWSRRKLSAIDKHDVSRLQAALKDGHGTSTSNRVFELLRAMFNWFIKKGLHDGSNPCAGLSKYKETPRKRFIRGDEAQGFFAALAALPDGAFKDFVLLSLFTAARMSNVLGARWADLDLVVGLWTIPDELSKSGDAMTLPLTSRALEVFARRRAAAAPDAVFVFPANSKSGHMTKPAKAWAAFVKSAGLDDFRRHDLRRTAGSWAAMTGASLPIIGKALGQKSPAATAIYARLQTDPALAALQRAQDAMARVADEPKASVHDLGQRRSAARRKARR